MNGENRAQYIQFTPNVLEQASPPSGRALEGPVSLRSAGRYADGSPRVPPAALGGWEVSRPTPRPAPVASAPRPRQAMPSRARENGADTSPAARNGRTGFQDEWLDRMRHAGTIVDVLIGDGTVLAGRLVSFDTYSLILEVDGTTLLLFKHAVTLIRPQQP